jgi:hypothetical protein
MVKTLPEGDPMLDETCPVGFNSQDRHAWHCNGLVYRTSDGYRAVFEDWSCQTCGTARERQPTETSP